VSYLCTLGGFLHLRPRTRPRTRTRTRARPGSHLALGHARRLLAAELDVAIGGVLAEPPLAVGALDVVWATATNNNNKLLRLPALSFACFTREPYSLECINEHTDPVIVLVNCRNADELKTKRHV